MMPSDDPRPPKRETYDLLGGPIAPPALPGRVVVGESDYEAVDLAASDLVAQAMNCVREFGDFHLALSGGRTPQPLYERLMYDPDFRAVPWQRTHLWIVDERCVPWDDPRSNFGMIHDTIVQHADLPPEQVHPMPVLLDGG
ncbi:MAG: 6-phosphogluconolactonase, partial [Phycisphaerales bacterium]|nr:6-phosphogluconolactonase [Phycisphaerales bacterium]